MVRAGHLNQHERRFTLDFCRIQVVSKESHDLEPGAGLRSTDMTFLKEKVK